MRNFNTKKIIINISVIFFVLLFSVVELFVLGKRLDGLSNGKTVFDYSEGWKLESGENVLTPIKIKTKPGEITTIHNTIPEYFADSEGTIVFHSFYQKVSVSLDEKEIYSFDGGDRDKLFKDFVPKNWNLVNIPSGSAGKDISISVSSKYISFSNVFFHFSYGRDFALIKQFEKANIFEFIMTTGIVFIGLVFLMLEVIAAFRRKGISPLLPFSLFSIIIGLLFCTQNAFFEFFIVDPEIASIMSFALFSIVPIPYLLYERSFVNKKQLKVINIMLIAILGILIVETILNMTGIADIFQTYYFYRAVDAVAMIYMHYCSMKNNRHIATSTILVSSIVCSYIVFIIVGKTGLLMVLGIYAFIFQVGNTTIYELHQKDIKNENLRMRIERIKSGNVFSMIETHFFYNNMGILRYMIKDNPDKAYKLMGNFSKYLRYKTDGAASVTGLIMLSQEVKAAKNYTEMKKIQLEDKLEIEYDISCDDFLIPVLTVEPLIKCLIRLSVTPLGDKGKISVFASNDAEYNRIEITSDALGTDGANDEDGKEISMTFKAIEERLKKFGANEMQVFSNGNRNIRLELLIAKQLKEGDLPDEDDSGR